MTTIDTSNEKTLKPNRKTFTPSVRLLTNGNATQQKNKLNPLAPIFSPSPFTSIDCPSPAVLHTLNPLADSFFTNPSIVVLLNHTLNPLADIFSPQSAFITEYVSTEPQGSEQNSSSAPNESSLLEYLSLIHISEPTRPY